MKSFFDILAIASGIIGMGGIVYYWTPLTPENASLHGARAVIVLAFVIVPYFIARALEKVDVGIAINRIRDAWLPNRQPLHEREKVATETQYFDYFFQPGSAHDWSITSIMEPHGKKSQDDNSTSRKLSPE